MAIRDTVPPKQLAFDLPADPRYGREDFLVGPANEAAYTLIEAWPNWPDTVCLLTGPPGSGKSHLASIWATRSHAWTARASEITAATVPHFLSNGALVIEDIDRIGADGGVPRDEAALFHLLNLARERACPVLVTSATSVDGLGLTTADLRSRLRLAPGATILPPDDALLRAVLVKLFVDRQLVVDLAIVEALALRIDRSLGRAREVVTALDRDALSRGRRITKPLALAVLERLGFGAGEPEDEDEADPEDHAPR
jgi:chromosomal replication initiation ATPase DnaA